MGVRALRPALMRLTPMLIGSVLGTTSCGGGSSSSDPVNAAVMGSSEETGAYSKAVKVAGGPAVVALFPDGRAFYSPDGFNFGGGGNTVSAYNGTLLVKDIVGLGGGILALLSNGSAYLSPDGQNLGGGGATLAAYRGSNQIGMLVQVGSGVDAVFANGSSAYYSPDGLNLGGGGNTVRIYAGSAQLQQIVPVGPGDAVVARFAGGAAFYSPDNRDLGCGTNTVSAAAAASPAITRLVPVGGGVLVEFADGKVYLSPDGKNLGGGGGTIADPAWDPTPGNGPFPARDSAHGAMFLGRMWLSGGFADPLNSNSCFSTCSFYDLWSSTDSQGLSWNTSPAFATGTTPNPCDANPIDHDGVQDAPLPTDFYDSYSALTVWNGQLTAIGSTVWRSVDGVTWLRNNLADGTAAPGPLAGLTRANENVRALAVGGALYFLQPDTGNVFRSTDPNAAVWTFSGVIPGFTPRCGAAAFTLLGKMWVTGGGACDYSRVYNDIWSSPDGVNWTQSPNPAPWSARMWPCVALGHDGVLWLAGGYAQTDWNKSGTLTVRYGANHADVWYSRDGIDWKQLKADAGSGLPDDGKLEPRHAATCYVAGATTGSASLVMIAGTGGSDPNGGDARVINSIRVLPLPAAASLP